MSAKIEINRGARTTIGQSGVGFIVIPDYDSRKEYIENCYRTLSVTMNGGYGYSYIANVKVLPNVMPQIKFPEEEGGRGTAVFWIRENFTNRPIIIGIIPDEDFTSLLSEGQEGWVQKVGDNVVELFSDAANDLLNISVINNTGKPANIKIKANSGNGGGTINVESDGLVQVSGDVVNIRTKDKLNIDEGKEPMVLGQTLVDLLKDLVDAIQNITVQTPQGPSSNPVNLPTFIEIGRKIENILSQKSNLD